MNTGFVSRRLYPKRESHTLLRAFIVITAFVMAFSVLGSLVQSPAVEANQVEIQRSW
jgi:hypothetical protein